MTSYGFYEFIHLNRVIESGIGLGTGLFVIFEHMCMCVHTYRPKKPRMTVLGVSE